MKVGRGLTSIIPEVSPSLFPAFNLCMQKSRAWVKGDLIQRTLEHPPFSPVSDSVYYMVDKKNGKSDSAEALPLEV
jgi:hypothetical protein